MSVLDEAFAAIREGDILFPPTRVVARPMPVAGGGFTVPVPGTQQWSVISVSFKLVNAAAAGARVPSLTFLDPDGTAIASIPAAFTLGNGLTSRFLFAVGIQTYGANDAVGIGTPIPPYKLDVDSSLAVSIATANAADQVSEIRLGVSQWNVRP